MLIHSVAMEVYEFLVILKSHLKHIKLRTLIPKCGIHV